MLLYLICLMLMPLWSALQAVPCGTNPCTTKSCLTRVVEQACLRGDAQVAANLLAATDAALVCDVIQCMCDEECLGRILFFLAKRVSNGQGADAVKTFIGCLCKSYDACSSQSCESLTNIVASALAYSFVCDPISGDQCSCPTDSASFVLVKTVMDAGCSEMVGVVLYKLVKSGASTDDIVTLLRGLIIWLSGPCCEQLGECLYDYNLNDYSTVEQEGEALIACITDSLKCVFEQFTNNGSSLKAVFCSFVSSMISDPGLGYTSVSSFIMKLVQSLLVEFTELEQNPFACFQDLLDLARYGNKNYPLEALQQLKALAPDLCTRIFCSPFLAKALSLVYIGLTIASGVTQGTLISGQKQTFTTGYAATCCVGPAAAIVILIDVLLRFVDSLACGFATEPCDIIRRRLTTDFPFFPPNPNPYSYPEVPYYFFQETNPCAQFIEGAFPNTSGALQSIVDFFKQLIFDVTGTQVASGDSLDETLRALYALITGGPVPAEFDQTCCMAQLFLCFSTARAFESSQSVFLSEWALANQAQGAACFGQPGACSVTDSYLCENDPCTFFFVNIVKQFLQLGLVDNAVVLVCCSNLGTAGLDCLITSIYNPAWLATLLVGMKQRNELGGYPSCNYAEFLERICCLDSDKACLVWQNALSAASFLECADPKTAGILSSLIADIQSLCYPTILPCVVCNLVGNHQSLDDVCNILHEVRDNSASTADFNAFVCSWFDCMAENCTVGVAGATALLNCVLNCQDYEDLGQAVLDALCCCPNADKWTKVIVDVLEWRALSGKSLPTVGGGCL